MYKKFAACYQHVLPRHPWVIRIWNSRYHVQRSRKRLDHPRDLGKIVTASSWVIKVHLRYTFIVKTQSNSNKTIEEINPVAKWRVYESETLKQILTLAALWSLTSYFFLKLWNHLWRDTLCRKLNHRVDREETRKAITAPRVVFIGGMKLDEERNITPINRLHYNCHLSKRSRIVKKKEKKQI